MLLYLVRHGDALPGAVDAERPLSPKGIKDAQKLAGFLKRNNIQLDCIFHSGLKRARETADIISQGMGDDTSISIRGSLGPEDPLQPICIELEQRTEDLMLVGHLPFLALLVSRLLLGSEKKEIIEFKKGAIVLLERNEMGKWKFRWFVTPKLI